MASNGRTDLDRRPVCLKARAMRGPPQDCVYTVLTGGYEPLNEQPVTQASTLPFICFTDMPDTTSATWEIRPLPQLFTSDPVRNQRAGKLRPTALLPEFSRSLYIDNSVLLQVPPEQIFAAVDISTGMALPRHSFRATLLDEFAVAAEHRLDDPARIAEQLTHYQAAVPHVLVQAPYWNAILLRDHHHPTMRAAMEIWLAHVLRYSRRDQLSAAPAFYLAGLNPAVMEIDNYQSWFHTWPHIKGRKAERRLWGADEGEALKRLVQNVALEQRLARLEHENQALLSATTWRLMQPVRDIVGWLRRKAA